MPSEFTKLNDFQKSKNGVYCDSSTSTEFNYTDGPQSEQALHHILSNASDLGSDSAELEAHIVDWPTEYHLSPSRANLLRCLDLSGVKRVLELGCGCGSISRYLGEQAHLQVDSIEGSETRAALAALRCKDLSNVTISVANFNEVKFPDNYYDLVLFVGVTEYAGRFSDRATDQEALQDLLLLAKKTSVENGTTLVAIENRTGLKYMLGATEDHFGKPYVGIENYPERSGIRTYTKSEWQQEIAQAEFSENVFLYPFPDYKIPTQVLHHAALEAKNAELKAAVSKIKSRDYLMPFDLGEQEAMLWQGLYEAGNLDDHANSFLILLGNDLNRLNQLANFSIKQFSEKRFELRYTPAYATNDETADTACREENKVLRSELNLIKASRSWRYFSKLRPLLQALGLERK